MLNKARTELDQDKIKTSHRTIYKQTLEYLTKQDTGVADCPNTPGMRSVAANYQLLKTLALHIVVLL